MPFVFELHCDNPTYCWFQSEDTCRSTSVMPTTKHWTTEIDAEINLKVSSRRVPWLCPYSSLCISTDYALWTSFCSPHHRLPGSEDYSEGLWPQGSSESEERWAVEVLDVQGVLQRHCSCSQVPDQGRSGALPWRRRSWLQCSGVVHRLLGRNHGRRERDRRAAVPCSYRVICLWFH